MDVFDCHLCGCRKVGYDFVAEYHDKVIRDAKNTNAYTVKHYLILCRQCESIFYELKHRPYYTSGPVQYENEARISVFPSGGEVSLPSCLSSSVKKPYTSAIKCMDAGIFDAASVMFRKTVYMICKDQGVAEDLSGDEKIKALAIPQEVKDVLLNIKGIGDWGGHEDYSYSSDTLKRARAALDIVIKMLYEYREMLGQFVKTTAIEKGKILNDAKKVSTAVVATPQKEIV